ncbi:MAG: TonB family protein [Acidobacteriota bacterium]|nr:TonB family protein [Acidobacteriota bacterium]
MSKPRMTILALPILGVLVLLLFAVEITIVTAQTITGAETEEHKRGIELYRQGKYVEASKLLRKALKENKADVEAWYFLGLTLIPQKKEIKEASKAFETALTLRPKFAGARAGLAYTFLIRNKTSEAAREAQTALSLDPNMADAYYVIGVVRLRAGAREEAVQNADAAIKLNPTLAAAYLLKSQGLASFFGDVLVLNEKESPEDRKARYVEAAEALEKYLQLNPDSENKLTWTEQFESLRVHGAGTLKSDGSERVYSGKEVTTKARVLSKPEPTYTESARANQITGTVVLRAIFASDGTVKYILVVSGLPDGLTESAIRSARRIKFSPATLNGRPVSMFIQLEYNFNLY